MTKQRLAAALAIVAWSAAIASAGVIMQATPARLKPRPDNVAFVPILNEAPTLDGKLDEPVWQQAALIDTWIDRSTSAPDVVDARIRVLVASDHLYIGFTRGGMRQATLKQPKGGDEYGGSVLEMFLDPFGGKHRTRVQIVTNPVGLRYDAWDGNVKWNGEWKSAGRVDDDTWTIEVAVPFTNMYEQRPPNRPFYRANFCMVTHQNSGEQMHSWTGGWGDPLADYGVLYFGTPEQYAQSLRPRMQMYLDRMTYDVRDRAGVALVRLDHAPDSMLNELSLAAKVLQGDRVVASDTVAGLPSPSTELLLDIQSLPVGEYVLSVDLMRGGFAIANNVRNFSRIDRQVLPPAVPQGRIPIHVHPQQRTAGVAWPITTGVPFSAGSLHDERHVRLLDPQGREVACQTAVRSTWSPRGPIQWLGLDFIPTLGSERQTYTLEYGPDVVRAEPRTGIAVRQSDEQITVDTGPLKFSVDRRRFALISQASINGQPVINPHDHGGLSLVDHEGNRYRAALDREAKVIVEEQGPVRVTIAATGWYVREGSDGSVTSVELPTDRLGLFTVRLSAFAGSTLVKAAVSTTLTHDTNKIHLREMTIAIPTGASDARVGTGQSVVTLANQDYLLQHRSDRTVDREGVEHARGEGWIETSSPAAKLHVAVRRFWQLFPKEIGMTDGVLTIHPWPAHGRDVFPIDEQLHLYNIYKLRYVHQGRDLDFRFPEAYRVKLDEAHAANPALSSAYYKEMSYSNAQGMNIHTDLLLDFAPADKPHRDGDMLAKLVNDDPHALPEPTHTCATGVFGPLLHVDPQFADLERTNLRGWLHLTSRAEQSDDYGMFIHGNWNNSFQYHATPMAASIHRVWSNGHYQVARAPYVQYARSADPTWMDWGRDHSNALRDVAMVHYVSTQRSFPYHQLGAIFHAKGFAPWTGDAHVAAHPICIDHLIYDYYLFGNRRSLDALNDWIEGIKTASPGGYGTREGMTTMAELTEAYRLTWDGGLIELIERFRKPIVARFDEGTSWDYHNLLLMRDWAFNGDAAIVAAARATVDANLGGDGPGGIPHLDAFFAMMDNDPARMERWTTRLYRDSVQVLDRPGQFGDGMTDTFWYRYIYSLHKQPYALKAIKHFGMALRRPLHTAPVPAILAGKRTLIVAKEVSDQPFTVTLRSAVPPQGDIAVRVLRQDGTEAAAGVLPKAEKASDMKTVVLNVASDGAAGQYMVVIERHSIHDMVLWPMTSLQHEVAVTPAGEPVELTAMADGARLYFPPQGLGSRITVTSANKDGSTVLFLNSQDRIITRASASRFLGGSQQVTLDGEPSSVYVTGLIMLRGDDAAKGMVFSVDPAGLFEVDASLLKR